MIQLMLKMLIEVNKLRKKTIPKILFFIFIATFYLFSSVVHGEGVRGRLDGRGPYGLYPVTGVPVTVSSQYGRSSPSYSDYRGMYYIYGLRPGPHVLEIWTGGPRAMTFNIMVYRNDPVTDIAPIRVR